MHKPLDLIGGSRALQAGVAALTLIAAGTQMVRADIIPYANIGSPNLTSYSFTASATGDIDAFFVGGGGAGFDNEMGLLINGVSTGIIGLDNHSSTTGDELDLGHANAGDTLVFVLQNNSLGMNAYSDPSLNVPYDSDGSVGHNHIYSTAYTATSPLLGSIPVGTYVAFEDLPFPGADFNYDDESFVFTDVSVQTHGVPDAASSLTLLGMGCGVMGFLKRRLSR